MDSNPKPELFYKLRPKDLDVLDGDEIESKEIFLNLESSFSKEKWVRLLFLKTGHCDIEHDTPVCGASQTILSDSYVDGPFHSLEELKRKKEEIIKPYLSRKGWRLNEYGNLSSVSNDIFFDVIKQFIKEKEIGDLKPEKYSLHTVKLRTNNEWYSRCRYSENYKKFENEVRELTKKQSSKFKEFERSVIILYNGILAEASGFELKSFKKKEDKTNMSVPWNDIIMDIFPLDGRIMEGIRSISKNEEFLSLKPVEISLEYNSIAEFIEKNKLI
jgi:hypothetical protein